MPFITSLVVLKHSTCKGTVHSSPTIDLSNYPQVDLAADEVIAFESEQEARPDAIDKETHHLHSHYLNNSYD